MSNSLYDSFIAGNKNELAVFIGEAGNEMLFKLKEPQITDITIEQPAGDFPTSEIVTNKNSYRCLDFVTTTITIESLPTNTVFIQGDNVRDELPEAVDNMSVEELLAAVNKKIEKNS